MSKIRRTYFYAGAALLIGAVIIIVSGHFFSDVQSTQETFSSPYAAIAKGRVDVEGGIVQLASSRDGIIKEVYVEEGDFVKKDQILAKLDDRQAELNLELSTVETGLATARLEPLKVSLEAAKREQARLDALLKRQIATQKEYDQVTDQIKQVSAELKVSEASAKVTLARQKLAEYELNQRMIRAPMDGRIIRRMARPGDGTSTLNVTSLFWFVPDTPRIIRAELEEHFIDVVKPGMDAEIVPESDETKTYHGRVIRLGHVFGPKRASSDDPQERADVRIVECVLSLDNQNLLLGQRVLVKFRKSK